MMDRLREGINSPIIKIILGLIMISFVFAGVGSYLVGGNSQYAAKVGDTKIGQGQLEKAYQEDRNRMQSQLGDYFTTLMQNPAYQQQFKNSVLSRLVNNVLLDIHAKDIGLAASDEQVKQQIFSIPQFQKDGKFDNSTYLNTLKNIGYTADNFAYSLKSDLVRNQLVQAIQGSEFALPSEMNAIYQLQAQKRYIRSYSLNIKDFVTQSPITEKEIQTYYDAHNAQFMQAEQVKVDYIELSSSILKEKFELSDQQADDRFYKLQSKLADKAFEFPDTLDDAAKAVGLEVKTSDFISSQTAKGVLANEKVLKAAFSDEVKNQGLNSEVIQISDTDIIVVRVQDSKPAKLKPLDSVLAEIKTILRKNKARNLAQQKAQQLITDLKAGKTTLSFGKQEVLVRNAQHPQLTEKVFSLLPPVDGQPQYTLVENPDNMQIIALDKVELPKALTDEQYQAYKKQYVAYQAQASLQLSIETLKGMIDISYPEKNVTDAQ